MVLSGRESLRMVASKHFVHWNLVLESGIGVPSPIASLHEVLQEVLVIALGLDPDVAHGIKDASLSSGFFDSLVVSTTPQLNARRGQMNIMLDLPCLICRPANQSKCGDGDGAEHPFEKSSRIS